MCVVTLIYKEDYDTLSENTTIITRDNVDDLTDMMDFLGDALRGLGFTYVENVGWEDSKGNVNWGSL